MNTGNTRNINTRNTLVGLAFCAAISVSGCSAPEGDTSATGVPAAAQPAPGSAQGSETPAAQIASTNADDEAAQTAARRFGGATLDMPGGILTAQPEVNANRNAYFGDLHVHTEYSFDAFAFGTVATPYDAYRYAQGEAIKHPAGFELKLKAPLDFYAVTDHAMFLGAVKAAADTSTAFSKLPHVQGLHNLNRSENQNEESMPQRFAVFSTFLGDTMNAIGDGSADVDMVNQIAKDAWTDIIAAARTHYRPGKFTTFVAYEYTSSTDDRGNLHRNVIFRDSDKLPVMPFSRMHNQNPEGLWDWMDGLRGQGIEALAIPHNSNGSNGQMFKMVDWAGDPLDDGYAEQRIRNEPLVELTQNKGTSETHPALSDNDEWADFEIMPYRVGVNLPSKPSGSYARQALLNGLTLEDRGIANAYQFGFVAASDTHTGAGSVEEDNFFSKIGLGDFTGQLRGSVPISEDDAKTAQVSDQIEVKRVDGKPYRTGAFETWGASGLTGVWAEENTRDAIYRAFRRKETFATSGPRMKVRLFGGFGFEPAMLEDKNLLTRAYRDGVSMGSELLAHGGEVPSFVAWATRDPNSAPLQRLQIVKGWTVNGEHHEQVYDVACSDGGKVDPATHRCPDNGAKVNLSDCAFSRNLGAGELKALWRDPDFVPAHRAFYYVRALENPTCRWSTWDAIRAGVAPRSDLKSTIQERVWSSPIWYMPAQS